MSGKQTEKQTSGMAGACPNPNYAYTTLREYEELVGRKVCEAFRTGWDMARTTTDHLAELAKTAERGEDQ
jgi:hypothetical protein